MADKASLKLNLPKSTTFIEMPLDFTGRTARGRSNPFDGLLSNAQFMLALIYTLNKAYRTIAKITYDDFMNILGIGSRETVRNALNILKERNLIEEVKQSHYKIKACFNKRDYLKIDTYLFKTKFKIGKEEKRLTRSSIKALALVDRGNRNPKTNGVFISSQARIGKAVNLPRTTAGDSIREIISGAFITCEKAPDSYGASKRGLYQYKVAPEVLAVKREKPKPAEQPKPQPPKQTDNGQGLRVLIEKHFAELRLNAEQRAARVLAKANSDKDYSAIASRINALNFEVAVASVRNPAAAVQLEEERRKLEAAGDKRLAALGIDKAELSPQYTCTVCSDTGYDSQGKPCKCLNKFIQTVKNKA